MDYSLLGFLSKYTLSQRIHQRLGLYYMRSPFLYPPLSYWLHTIQMLPSRSHMLGQDVCCVRSGLLGDATFYGTFEPSSEATFEECHASDMYVPTQELCFSKEVQLLSVTLKVTNFSTICISLSPVNHNKSGGTRTLVSISLVTELSLNLVGYHSFLYNFARALWNSAPTYATSS